MGRLMDIVSSASACYASYACAIDPSPTYMTDCRLSIHSLIYSHIYLSIHPSIIGPLSEKEMQQVLRRVCMEKGITLSRQDVIAGEYCTGTADASLLVLVDAC